jgi:hypothetical protein
VIEPLAHELVGFFIKARVLFADQVNNFGEIQVLHVKGSLRHTLSPGAIFGSKFKQKNAFSTTSVALKKIA